MFRFTVPLTKAPGHGGWDLNPGGPPSSRPWRDTHRPLLHCSTAPQATIIPLNCHLSTFGFLQASGRAALVEHRNNQHLIRADQGVSHRVGKSAETAGPELIRDRSPSIRRFQDPLDDSVQFVDAMKSALRPGTFCSLSSAACVKGPCHRFSRPVSAHSW